MYSYVFGKCNQQMAWNSFFWLFAFHIYLRIIRLLHT